MIAQVTIADQVRQYVDRVLRGDIVASKTVIGACRRHVQDLDKIADPGFPYEFNHVKADACCRFFPLVLRHSMGEWAGHPFELSDWQMFVIWSIFGWVQKSDGMRRFRKAYISVARKNGKSTLVAGIGLLTMHLDKEEGAQIFIGATKREQASIIHHEAEKMTRASPSLSRITKIHKLNMSVAATNSFMRPVSSDKPYDGLNPHCVLLDELHAWTEQHRKFFETITSGSASRRQPLFVWATTAGDDKSYIWLEEDKHATDVATGIVQDDRLFAYVATIDENDDIFDETVWEKANPNLGVSVKLDYLRSQAAEAKAKIGYRRAFTRYHCNRKVSAVASPITLELWAATHRELSDVAKADAIGIGIDLGGRKDLAAWASCCRYPIDGDSGKLLFRYELRCKSFIASNTNRDVTVQPWQRWLYEGKLASLPSPIGAIKDQVVEWTYANGCTQCAFDPHNARQLGDELVQFGVPAVAMPQSHGHYNEVIREFLAALESGRIVSDITDEVLTWAACNLTIDTNQKDESMPDRGAAKDKIDPIVACLMAFRAAYFAPVYTGSYYDNNGLEVG